MDSGNEKVLKVFEKDELRLGSISPDWEREFLLSQEAVFFLKDVVKVLKLDSAKVKRHVKELCARKISPWEAMGTRKVWNHWIVRMKVFAPYYRAHLVSKVRQLEQHWDGNDLLNQEGIFLLTDVCRLIPFSTHQLRYQAKRNRNAKEEYGIWKDTDLNAFVVDMAIFSVWINELWSITMKTEGEYRPR